MFPRLPPSGPGSLNSSFGVPTVNVGEVVTSTDITSMSGESRLSPRQNTSLPSARQCSIAWTPSFESRHFPSPVSADDALKGRTYISPRSGCASSDR